MALADDVVYPWCVFTFHYGSILMKIKPPKNFGAKRFTFHYGSILMRLKILMLTRSLIYIPLWFYSNKDFERRQRSGLVDLHSTMVLF